MGGWTHHESQAVALPLANVDTDQLIPARFMSASRTEGYGKYLLYDMRRNDQGDLAANFPLNVHSDASVLIAGANFGSGSSREAAVYALVDAGFRAIFAPSFGDIFASNAVNNTLLPARVSEADHTALLAELGQATCSARIDLASCRATFGEREVAFTLDDTWRQKLINGWDDIDLTKQHAARIRAFRNSYLQTTPWARPRGFT